MVLHGLKKPVHNDAHDNLMKEHAAVTAFVPLLEMIVSPKLGEIPVTARKLRLKFQ